MDGPRARDWAFPALISFVLLVGAGAAAYGHESEPARVLAFVLLVGCALIFAGWSRRNYLQARDEQAAFLARLRAEAASVTWQSELADKLTLLARTSPDLAATMRLYMRPEWILEPARAQAPRRITLAATRVTLTFVEYCFNHSTDKTWLSERNHFGDGTFKFDDHHEVSDRDQYRELTKWLERNGYIWLVREGRPYEWRHPWTIQLVRKAFFGDVSEEDLEKVRED